MVRPQDEMNYFAVMGLTPNATEVDIRKAYRKLSLALHPDKNRNMDSELASAKFHEMQLAYEILMDPAARLAAAERNKAEELRKERRGAYEGKRKEMAEELEKREEEERLKRFKGVQDEQKRKLTLEKLREEGRKLREQKERQAIAEREEERLLQEQRQQKDHQMGTSTINSSFAMRHPRESIPDLGPLDLTVRLRFPADQFAAMTASSSSSPLESTLARGLEARFGKLDSLIYKQPKNEKEGKKTSREITAHATFKTLDSAFAAVKAGSELKAGLPGLAEILEDVWIGWAAGPRSVSVNKADGGMIGEPERIAWLRQHNNLSSIDGHDVTTNQKVEKPVEEDLLSRMKQASGKTNGQATPEHDPQKTHTRNEIRGETTEPIANDGATPNFTSFESSTLQKMREAERRRMEEAILEMDKE